MHGYAWPTAPRAQRDVPTGALRMLTVRRDSTAIAAHLELQIDGVEGPLRDAARRRRRHAGVREPRRHRRAGTSSVRTRAEADRRRTRTVRLLQRQSRRRIQGNAGRLRRRYACASRRADGGVGLRRRRARGDARREDRAQGVGDVQSEKRRTVSITPPTKKARPPYRPRCSAAAISMPRSSTKSVDVSRSATTRASLHLAWDVGPRYRYGATDVRRRPVPRHVPRSLRAVERRRFLHAGQAARAAAAADRRRLLRRREGAARHRARRTTASCRSRSCSARPSATIYTGGVFIDTDIGFGVRGGIAAALAQRARTQAASRSEGRAETEDGVASSYSIPLPGPNNRSYNFGVNYLNENTDTTVSHTDRWSPTRRGNGWASRARSGCTCSPAISTSSIRAATSRSKNTATRRCCIRNWCSNANAPTIRSSCATAIRSRSPRAAGRN